MRFKYNNIDSYAFSETLKIFRNVATRHITRISPKVIRPSQKAFMPEQLIPGSVLVIEETIHEFHSNKMDDILFKYLGVNLSGYHANIACTR
jgi:hypothetical protein